MSDVVIKIENLSKKYLISHESNGASYSTLRDSLTNSFRKLNPFSSESFFSNDSKEEFWALKDIDLEIKRGEKIGVIGRNGAGKSTLLKILSRITDPTTGSVKIKGRIASLLEVGTGFHPELSGRENIYLNGAILGMTKAEIKKKFDEIVEFSGVEKFLDTPVKRYSSGMYVRLAFAVAAHLESEILIIDEVLAVGDAEFQKKCLGKMDEVSKAGRTVIFVSHNMGAIRQLCEKGLLLDKGKIQFYDRIDIVTKSYESNLIKKITNNLIEIKRIGDLGSKVLFSKANIFNKKKENVSTLFFNEEFFLKIEIQSLNDDLEELSIGVRFETFSDTYVTSCLSQDSNSFFSIKAHETKKIKVEFENFYLNPGEYYVTLSIRKGKTFYDQIVKVMKIAILDYSKNKNTIFNNAWGLVKINSKWSTYQDSKNEIL